METQINFTWCQCLVYHFASLFGLAPFALRDNNLHPISSARKVYLLIIVGLNLTLTFITDGHHPQGIVNGMSLNRLFGMMHSIIISACMFFVISSFVFKSNKLMDLVSRIASIKTEMRKLGIDDAHQRNQRKFYGRIIASNFAILSMTVAVASVYDVHIEGTAWKMACWTGVIIRVLLSHNTILIFVETMICISQLFESLNDNLRGTTLRPEDGFLSTPSLRKHPVTMAHQTAPVTNGDVKNIHLSVGGVEKIGKLHRKLSELVISTTDLFVVFLLVTILLHFSRLLVQSYLAYTYTYVKLDAFQTPNTIAPHIQEWVARTVISVLELFLIANGCSSVCRMGNATKTILFQVWNKFYPEKMRNEFVKFTVQLMHKPVTVSAFEFFNLDYSYLFKIFYAVLAYFIIVVQLDSSRATTGT